MDEKDKDKFYKNYQINRNLSYIKNSNDYVVFIYSLISKDLNKELTDVLKKNTSINKQVKAVDWNHICNIALNKSTDIIFHQHFKLFKDKYII